MEKKLELAGEFIRNAEINEALINTLKKGKIIFEHY